MHKLLNRFGQLYPLIISFFISFLVIQATFLYQYRTTNFTELLLFSVIEILSQLSLFCIFGASLLFIIPESSIKWFKRFYFFLLFAALIGSVVCDQYLLFSRERLDESFFLFDWEEIWMIADPTNRFTWSLAFGMILIFSLPFSLFKFFKGFHTSKAIFPILVFGCIFLGFIPRSSQVDNVSENRFVYFLQRSLNSYFFSIKPSNATLKDFKNVSSDFFENITLDHFLEHAQNQDVCVKDTNDYNTQSCVDSIVLPFKTIPGGPTHPCNGNRPVGAIEAIGCGEQMLDLEGLGSYQFQIRNDLLAVASSYCYRVNARG
jgi:hypothetical protein